MLETNAPSSPRTLSICLADQKSNFATHSSPQVDRCVCENCPVRELSICAALNGNELIILSKLAKVSKYPSRATLVKEHRLQDGVHIITQGFVRLCKTRADGHRQVIGFAMPGDVVALAVEGRNAYTAEAVGDVSSCFISNKAFAEMVSRAPQLLRRLSAITAEGLSQAHSHMMLLGQCSARQRLASFIIEMRDRWHRANGSDVLVNLPMSRQDIADYLGLTIETISRTVTLFARQKLIVVIPNGVRILNVAKLEAAAYGL